MRSALIAAMFAGLLGGVGVSLGAPPPEKPKKPPQPKTTPQEEQRLRLIQQQSAQLYSNWAAANALRAMALINAYRNWYLMNAWRNYAYASSRATYLGMQTPYVGTGSPGSTGTTGTTTPGTPGTPESNTLAVNHQLQAAETTVVRLFKLPAVDETGNPKKYTPEETKELKGPDPNVIGYNAMFEDLKVGTSCRVSVARKRTDPNDPNKVTWVPTGQLTGKITKIDEGDKTFTLQVATAKPRGQADPPVMEVALDASKRPMLILILSQPAAEEVAKKP